MIELIQQHRLCRQYSPKSIADKSAASRTTASFTAAVQCRFQMKRQQNIGDYFRPFLKMMYEPENQFSTLRPILRTELRIKICENVVFF
jgi:uncharacterized protein CbrC (UPF0167 family)